MIRLDLVHIECHEYVFMFLIFYTISRKGKGIHSSSQATRHSGSSTKKTICDYSLDLDFTVIIYLMKLFPVLKSFKGKYV